jgi:hypothetical protein
VNSSRATRLPSWQGRYEVDSFVFKTISSEEVEHCYASVRGPEIAPVVIASFQ